MADSLNSRKTTKCRLSGTRKGQKLQSWILWILIQCFISFPCLFSNCLGENITVSTYPEGDMSVEYGNPFEIYCVAGSSYSSNDIEFTLGTIPIESQIVNETTRRLYFHKPDKQMKVYYCKNLKTNEKSIKRVLVDTLPDPVTDFNCISMNLEILNCSWTSPTMVSHLNYSVTFSIDGNIVTPACLAEKNENTHIRYCAWNTSSRPRYRQIRDEQIFHLTSCNVFGCIHQNFTIDHYSIVKPDPPIDLRVVKNGTHSVKLKWKIPNNMIDFCPVDHIIEYQIAKIDNKTYFHNVDTSSLPPSNKTYKFNITNLPYANMQYEVRVYIKSKKAVKKEFWSNYSYTVFYTASEKPKRPPDMIAGSFAQGTFNNGRYIWVYWKQLEEYEEAGANFTYKVVVSQDNKTQTLFADKHKSLSYVTFNASSSALDVTVWSFNAVDSSENSSHLYIPHENDTQPQVSKFAKVAYENGTYELSWQGMKNVDNYTLFWCQHNQTQICAGRMDFTVLEPNKSAHIINLPREYRYQFAISVNNGTKTSGMVWAKCDISREGFVMYGFPVKLMYDTPGKFSVTLRWVMECVIQEGIIIGYNISYCPIVQTSSFCDKSVKNKHKFIDNPKQMEVTIKDLLPARTYQFTLALNTIYGQKNIENASAHITTSEDTPTKPVNVIISDIKNDSLVISWDPPLQRNGNIGKYHIYRQVDDQNPYVDSVSWTDTSRRQVKLTNLIGFTNYSLTVQACNIPIGLCSKIDPNDRIFVRTRIGPPSKLKAPSVKNDPEMLQWKPPEIPGGTVDWYQIKRVKDDMESELFNTTDLQLTVKYCEGVVSRETYQVRAINVDTDLFHGVIYDNMTLPTSYKEEYNEYPGEWSEPSIVACRRSDGLVIIFIFMAVFALGGAAYGGFKLVKKIKKIQNIKPVLPSGLDVPEKDTKYTFGVWNPTTKDEKPSSDEILLLPNSKTVTLPAHTKQKDDNCGSSEHTDSTALSDSTRGAVDRQASTSDDGSDSSLNMEAEQVKVNDQNISQDGDPSTTESESSCEDSPYLSDPAFKKNSASGYVPPFVNAANGYVQPAPQPIKSPQPTVPNSQPSNSSYVMAGLPPPAFSSGVPQSFQKSVSPPSGYVLCEEPETKGLMNFPKINTSPSKIIGVDTLPTMPTLPSPAKLSADNSYIQLQSLDSLPSLKPSVRNTVPLKPPTSSGYVSHADVVINKHLNNMLTAAQLGEESAILDPTMSPDAYCRFSWNTDPANDNLHSLLTDSPKQTSKN